MRIKNSKYLIFFLTFFFLSFTKDNKNSRLLELINETIDLCELILKEDPYKIMNGPLFESLCEFSRSEKNFHTACRMSAHSRNSHASMGEIYVEKAEMVTFDLGDREIFEKLIKIRYKLGLAKEQFTYAEPLFLTEYYERPIQRGIYETKEALKILNECRNIIHNK